MEHSSGCGVSVRDKTGAQKVNECTRGRKPQFGVGPWLGLQLRGQPAPPLPARLPPKVPASSGHGARTP